MSDARKPVLVATEARQEAADPIADEELVEAGALALAPATATAPSRLAALPPLTPAAPPGALTRSRALAGSALLQLQYQVMRLGVAGQIGAAAILAALVLGLSVLLPGHQAVSSLGAELSRLQHHAPAAPAGTTTVSGFMQALPTRAEMPAVLGKFVEQAKQAGVQLDNGHYAFSPAQAGGISRYEIEFPLKGDYPNIRAFINSALSAVPAAGLDKLQVERKSIGDHTVSADVRFVVFVRSEP